MLNEVHGEIIRLLSNMYVVHVGLRLDSNVQKYMNTQPFHVFVILTTLFKTMGINM